MPSFIRRLSTAFAAAGLVFTIPFLVLTLPRTFDYVQTAAGLIASLINGLDVIAILLAVVLAGIFIVGYPVERWLVKPSWGAWKAAGTYSLVFLAITLVVGIIAGFLSPYVWYAEQYAIMAFVAGIVATMARLIYPGFLKLPKTSYTIAAALAVLAILGPAIPPMNVNDAPVSRGIFPALIPGELSRGTWSTNPKTGISGTDFYLTQKLVQPNHKYELSVRCLPRKHAVAMTVTIASANGGKERYSHNFKCVDNNVITTQISFTGQAFTPRVMVDFVQGNSSVETDAWAILAPVGAVSKFLESQP